MHLLIGSPNLPMAYFLPAAAEMAAIAKTAKLPSGEVITPQALGPSSPAASNRAIGSAAMNTGSGAQFEIGLDGKLRSYRAAPTVDASLSHAGRNPNFETRNEHVVRIRKLGPYRHQARSPVDFGAVELRSAGMLVCLARRQLE